MDHGIQDGEQFSHTSHQSHFERLALIDKVLEMCPNNWIETAGRKSSHVKGVAYTSSPTPNGPFSTHPAAIAIERSHAHQGGDLLAIELSQFRQLGQQCDGCDWANAGYGTEQVFFFPPDRALPKLVVQILIDLTQFLLQPVNMFLEMRTNRPMRRVHAIFLGNQHFNELATADKQCLQLECLFIRQVSRFRMHGFTKMGQHQGIDLVSFSQPPQRLGKGPGLPRVDHGHRQPCYSQGTRSRHFIPTCGFQYDQCRLKFGQFLHQVADPLGIVILLPTLICWPYRNIQMGFTYINSYVSRFIGGYGHCVLVDDEMVPTLPDTDSQSRQLFGLLVEECSDPRYKSVSKTKGRTICCTLIPPYSIIQGADGVRPSWISHSFLFVLTILSPSSARPPLNPKDIVPAFLQGLGGHLYPERSGVVGAPPIAEHPLGGRSPKRSEGDRGGGGHERI